MARGYGEEPPLSTSWVEISRAPSRKTIEDHALVLDALGIPWGIGAADGQHVLVVPAEDSDRAVLELFRYVRENVEAPSLEQTPRPLTRSVGAAAAYLIVLLGCDVLQRRDAFGAGWWDAGRADSALIRGGAWWRALTALTLHADALHLASNVVFGAAFGIMLAQSIGVGLAWAIFVVAGGLGNLANAWVQAPSHRSIGASTGIFAMLGAQAAHDWLTRRRRHSDVWRRWAPIAIGAVLLAWLGGETRPTEPVLVPPPRIDVWAHVLGFGMGLLAGAVVGAAGPRLSRFEKLQIPLALAALVALGFAWALAI